MSGADSHHLLLYDYVEEFVDADPYVQAGLVRQWRIEPWNLL